MTTSPSGPGVRFNLFQSKEDLLFSLGNTVNKTESLTKKTQNSLENIGSVYNQLKNLQDVSQFTTKIKKDNLDELLTSAKDLKRYGETQILLLSKNNELFQNLFEYYKNITFYPRDSPQSDSGHSNEPILNIKNPFLSPSYCVPIVLDYINKISPQSLGKDIDSNSRSLDGNIDTNINRSGEDFSEENDHLLSNHYDMTSNDYGTPEKRIKYKKEPKRKSKRVHHLPNEENNNTNYEFKKGQLNKVNPNSRTSKISDTMGLGVYDLKRHRKKPRNTNG